MVSIDKKLGIDVAKKLSHPHYHGSPYDRGSADSYYNRGARPHHYIGPEQGPFGGSIRVSQADMTNDEISAYMAGFNDNENDGNHKEW